jgi:hypothetical protein
MFGLFDAICYTIKNVVDDPVGTTVDIIKQPIVDGCDLLDGLTEGELRYKAALRLGADVVAGMAIGELVELMTDE